MRAEQMKTMVLLYDTSCIYEIVILNYFLNATGKEMIFVSPEGNPVMATEGYRIEAEDRLDHVNPGDVELLIIPGGDITQIDTPEVWEYLKNVHDSNGRIAAICAGVDVLEHAGLLEDAESIHSCEKDVVTSHRITTSRANGYVDFAIEVAKQMELLRMKQICRKRLLFGGNFSEWNDYFRPYRIPMPEIIQGAEKAR
jgi:putative intracellular protease/amidase